MVLFSYKIISITLYLKLAPALSFTLAFFENCGFVSEYGKWSKSSLVEFRYLRDFIYILETDTDGHCSEAHI